MQKTGTDFLKVRVAPSTKRTLDAAALRRGITLSEYVRRVLAIVVEEEREEEDRLRDEARAEGDER